ncbi:MAG: hypothetical protein DRG40_04280, partial [Deltaproteobacteria bacterium]
MSGLPKRRRDHLRRLVPRLRGIAEGAIEVKLRALGIFASYNRSHNHSIECFIRPAENLLFSEDEKKLREAILLAIEREKKGFEKKKEPEKTKEAILRYIKGAAYTLINRLSALKAMEARGLIEETVTRRPDYGGMSAREWKLKRKNPSISPDLLLVQSLELGFKEASQEIALLFDPDDPYGLLFPDPADLRKILKILNEEITQEDWQAEDILGWIYQFWNEEERRRYRTGRGRGRRKAPEPDEIPVINQLYTPHWVVKALVDNTLGRLWLEMKGRCPWEGALERIDDLNTVDGFCSYLVPLPSEPQKPEPKSPQEIKVLDPACGSGHFLIYAFEVLWRIWREAGPELSPEEVAARILEYNLYGIDIDLRACELAALGLYLKAKELIERALREEGFSDTDIQERAKAFRPRRMNIVCADVRLIDGERKEAFLKLFENEPDLHEIVKKLLEDLDNTYEYGSLLKVRGPFERLFEA